MDIFQVVSIILVCVGGIISIRELWRCYICKSGVKTTDKLNQCMEYMINVDEMGKAEKLNPKSDKFSWDEYEKFGKYLNKTFYKNSSSECKHQ